MIRADFFQNDAITTKEKRTISACKELSIDYSAKYVFQ